MRTALTRAFHALAFLVAICVSSTHAHAMPHETIDDSLQCTAQAIYHEARGATETDKHLVAQTVFNRTRSSRFPSTPCDVVHQKVYVKKKHKTYCSFTWYCDRSLNKINDRKSYLRAMDIALWEHEHFVKHGPSKVLYFNSLRDYDRRAYRRLYVSAYLQFLTDKHEEILRKNV